MAEAVLESAPAGETVALVEAAHVKAVVVALGKIGLPLAAQIARAGHEVIGCDIDAARRSSSSTPASRRSPARTGSPRRWPRSSATGGCARTTDTTAAVADGADLVVAVPPLVVDADAQPDWRHLDAVVADIGAGLQRRHDGVGRDDAAGRHHARPRRAARWPRHSGLRAEEEFFCVFSPERVYSGRVFRDLATYPKLVGGLSAAGEARGVELYRSFLERRGRGRWAPPRPPS